MGKEEQKEVIKIKKLSGGINFRVSYGYMPKLTEFIKNHIPREHWKVHIESTMINGKPKDIWSRDIRDFSIGKVLSFLLDNNMMFQFINMTGDDVKKLQDEYKARQVRLRSILKAKVEGIDVSDMDFSFMKIQPYNYQKQGVKFFEMNEGIALLGDQPGVGKTLTSFSYAVKHRLKTLIVCPSFLKLNWKKEIESFSNEKSFIFKYQPSKTSKYKNNLKEDSLFHIINYESLDTYIKNEFKHKCSSPKCKFEETNLESKYAKCPKCKSPKSVKSRRGDLLYFEDKEGVILNPDDYDLIILDECHYIKNEKAQRTVLVKKSFKSIKKKLLLSGTPIKNRPYEFFPLLNFLKPEQFNSSHEFAKKFCAAYEDKFGWKYDGASNLEELYETISPFFLRRLKSDISDIPAKTYINIPIELSEKQMKDYKKLESTVIEELLNEYGVEEGKRKKTQLEIIIQLKRFISEIKVKEVIPIIEDLIEQGEKVVVFSEFKSTAEEIKKYFVEKAVLVTGDNKIEERNDAVEAFQRADDDVMVFSGTIGAAGVGITLTRSSTLIFIGKSYSPSDNSQAEDRIHRITTTADKVTIMSLICEDTVDEAIELLLYNKSLVVDKVIDNKIQVKNIEKMVVDDNGSSSIFGQLVKMILNQKEE